MQPYVAAELRQLYQDDHTAVVYVCMAHDRWFDRI